ncbi:MFS transporter [Microvirga subterranea]|uniref:MFS transporter n=1 Tax=Microvirga subterranea TaxID=186651 RepID=A0A370HAX1_9HYPH|nr:MFS transporter [Microvirga subterranea]RDI53877.1 MFS transporter [Microvirga subterranea]
MLVRLLVPAPSISVAIFAPFAGLIADWYGWRLMLLAGVMLLVIAGCAGLFLPDLSTIFASRLVLGLVVALIMTAQTALTGDYFTDDRSALSGFEILAWNFGGLAFISLAGWFAAASPRLPFAIYGVAAVFLPLMWKVIVDPQGTSPVFPCSPAGKILPSFIMGSRLRTARASSSRDEHVHFRHADPVVVFLRDGRL